MSSKWLCKPTNKLLKFLQTRLWQTIFARQNAEYKHAEINAWDYNKNMQTRFKNSCIYNYFYFCAIL
ncbi:hypothetical protein CQA40_05620 [Helicobacter sp. MIT 01-3238]|nr:hypothetical protein CQA40_05620 [Helicobacter sp. MIT 01-3238]